jgi:hypothetical protein
MGVTLLVPPEPAAAYITRGRWYKNQITWESIFQYDVQRERFPASTRQHIAAGAYQWDDVSTGAYLNIDEGDYDAWITSYCFSCSGEARDPGKTRIFRRSDGLVEYVDTYLNSEWSWSDSICYVDFNNYYADVRVVLTHEIGHWLVLDHDPAHPEAVMLPTGTCKLTTVADDDAGARALYGP